MQRQVAGTLAEKAAVTQNLHCKLEELELAGQQVVVVQEELVAVQQALTKADAAQRHGADVSFLPIWLLCDLHVDARSQKTSRAFRPLWSRASEASDICVVLLHRPYASSHAYNCILSCFGQCFHERFYSVL